MLERHEINEEHKYLIMVRCCFFLLNCQLVKSQQMLLVDKGAPNRHQLLLHSSHIRLPGVVLGCLHVPDLAGVHLPFLWRERHMLGEVELPAGLKGQVRLTGISNLLPILQKGDGDVRRVESTHMADQGVCIGVIQLARVTAIYLHLGMGCFPVCKSNAAQEQERKYNFHDQKKTSFLKFYKIFRCVNIRMYKISSG